MKYGNSLSPEQQATGKPPKLDVFELKINRLLLWIGLFIRQESRRGFEPLFQNLVLQQGEIVRRRFGRLAQI